MLKRLVACGSISVALTCAVALSSTPSISATTDDSATGNITGLTPGSSALETYGPGQPDREAEANASYCTDANGMLYTRGSTGFRNCLSVQREHERREQAGRVGTPPTEAPRRMGPIFP
jgi:hypothetical protein